MREPDHQRQGYRRPTQGRPESSPSGMVYHASNPVRLGTAEFRPDTRISLEMRIPLMRGILVCNE
jgi:hypothetical protein